MAESQSNLNSQPGFVANQPQKQVMSPSLESEKQAQALLAIENSCNEASNAIVNAFGLQEANSHGVSALDQSNAMDVSSQSPDKQTYNAGFNVLKNEHIALRENVEQFVNSEVSKQIQESKEDAAAKMRHFIRDQKQHYHEKANEMESMANAKIAQAEASCYSQAVDEFHKKDEIIVSETNQIVVLKQRLQEFTTPGPCGHFGDPGVSYTLGPPPPPQKLRGGL